jgi:putative ABC transport system permease protein
MKEKDSTPSAWLFRLLSWFCPEHLLEEIEGDLIHQFDKDAKRFGMAKAKWRLAWSILRFFRPGILLRNKFSVDSNLYYMLRYHLKFATRAFLKDKFFSTLNILGLALGIAVGVILLLILQSDLSYDKHYALHDRIYRVGCHQQQTGLDIRWARSAMDLGMVLKTEMPEIEEVVRINRDGPRILVKHEGREGLKAFYEEGIIDADTTYFKVFDHPFIYGNPKTCLQTANAVVVTETIAHKYFGSEDPLGQSLVIGSDVWIVTGVIQDLPENTHLKFDLLMSNRNFVEGEKIASENFWNPGSYLYILVPKGYEPQTFQAKFPALFDKYFKAFSVEVDGRYAPILEPLAEIHFHSDLDQDEPQGNIAYLYGFGATGILIMIMACINYMNLSTAKSTRRATELAIKKLVGSNKQALAISILVESVFLSLISLLLALVVVYGVLNLTSFDRLIGKNLTFDHFQNPELMGVSLAVALCIGLLSGLYPAIFLSTSPLLTALKGKFKTSPSNRLFRKVLITMQFAISILVIVCTWFMGDQIEFISNKSLGFNKDNILVLPIPDSAVERNIPALKNALLQNPRIAGVTTGGTVVGANVGGAMNFWAETSSGMKQSGYTVIFVGEDYVKTMGLKISEGHDFRAGPVADDETPYIVNETAAKRLGWGAHAVGKAMKFFHGDIPGHVVGVVEDFNFKSLRHAVEPLLIVRTNSESGYLHIKLSGDELSQTISDIEAKWAQHAPGHPFNFFFLDQRFNEQYNDDLRQHKLLSILSGISIFISLLGLIGLSAFAATQRVKEIGIRKVLGANVPDILFLLSKDILLLVAFSAVLVIPVSWWVMTQWMENFVYKTQLDYSLYIIVTVMALILVFLTIGLQSFKSARANPVDSLKYE